MSDNPQQAPLSGQQISALQTRFNEAIQELYKDVRLRELAVEQARKMLKTSVTAQTPDQALELVRKVYAFLTEPANRPPPSIA